MNEKSTRSIELCTQDWELLRGAITREVRRWPPGHLNHFRLIALQAQISNCCLKRPARMTKDASVRQKP